MSKGVTEITEELKTQIEITQSGSGQIEVIDGNQQTSLDISFNDSFINADLDINTSESVISVESIPSNTQINIVDDSPSNLEIISENTSVDITERLIISGGFDFRFNNIIDNPLNNNDAGQIGIRTNNPQFDLHISGNLFSDVISSSRASFNDLSSDVISSSQTLLVSDGITNTLLIKSGSNTPISINPVGIIRFDNYQYTPPVVEGGLLYSGSEFYLGLE
jgi:hypothetical protein